MTQKIKEKNYCEIKNENKDRSDDNENVNTLTCVDSGENLKDVLTENFLVEDGSNDGATEE